MAHSLAMTMCTLGCNEGSGDHSALLAAGVESLTLRSGSGKPGRAAKLESGVVRSWGATVEQICRSGTACCAVPQCKVTLVV